MSLSFKKAFLLEILVFLLLVLGYFSADIYGYIKKASIAYTPPLGCELNRQNCALNLKDGSVLEVAVEPKQILPLQKTKFKVKNIGAKSVSAVIRGLNMEMGVHEYKFLKVGDSEFEADILLPSCSIDMKWQIDVFVEKNSGVFGGGFIVWSKKT